MANKNSKTKTKVKKQKKTKSSAQLNRRMAALSVAKPGYAPGLLGDIGGAAGGWFGSDFGKLGRRAGDWLGKITGMGDYEINNNTLMTNNGPPVFSSRPNGSIEICKREFLMDITGSTAFQNSVQIPINPGLFSSFPFLSALAANFEQYEMLGLIFEFKSTSANALNSTNTALGTVVLATNYDSLDPIFVNKQQMESYEFANSTAPSSSIIHPIECDPRLNALARMYVRTGAVPANGDARFYDLGLFQLATAGMQAASTIGELWVSYHVRLHKPKLPTPTDAEVLVYSAALTPVTAVSAWGTATPTYNSLGVSVITPTQISIPVAGRYLFIYTANAATSFTRASLITTAGGATGVVRSAALGWGGDRYSVGNGTATYVEMGLFTTPGTTGLLQVSPPTIVGAVSNASIQIFQVPGDFV